MAEDPPLNRHSQEEESPHQHGLPCTSSGSHKDWLKLGLASHSCPSPAQGGDRSPTPPAAPLMPGVPPAVCIRPPAIAAIPAVAPSKPMGDPDPPWLPQLPALPSLSPRAADAGCGGGAQLDGSTRVILPPPMPAAAAGVWFVLQAARDQQKEPFLPQIPRSYLRIRDGRVKVRVLIKYLINKLGLEDESEVQITCRGRPLLPLQTLQHVRDSVWCMQAGDYAVAVPSLSGDHVMVLHYGRRTTA